ncbi:alpha-L-fucosidase [Haloferula sp. A504]|uniref:alpha-L-fucosidase n=1 Tax=Haloferula sp. A504 TaxID=3373601 RepID=UPI0031C8430D|nr:alpha-L-fucosidase [Verrucomicrobiaceae bacterium E54]
MKFILTALCIISALVMPALAEDDEEADRTQWFREARFGMFIHWGVYAVPAGEWEGETIKGIGEWIMRFRKIPVEKYKSYAPEFTAAKYDPEAWADLAARAGMKYVVITSKHHDGFALYDSAVTDWDVMASGAKRDLLAPLAKAVRKRDMKFGLYYSQAQDWVHPGGATSGTPGKVWDPAQKGDFDEYLKTIALPQAREIIERYDPAIIWWDTPVLMTEERVAPFAALVAGHPDIINNNRLGPGFEGDTSTPEQHIPPRGFPGKMFEVCMTMNDTWGYKVNDRNWKSSQRLIRMLSDIASKGGNLLLNIGPRADGSIPQESIDRLEAIARWMDVNAEAIHATQASPFPRRLPWGRVTQRAGENGGTTLYLHIWDWPADGKILLPTLKELPSAGVMLKGGATVTAERTVDGVVVHLPGGATDPDISVARLEFPGPLTVTQQPYATPDADGTLTLLALDADAFGAVGGNIQVEGTGAAAYLTDWKLPNYRVEYRVQTGKAAKWKVEAEVAAAVPAKLSLKVGESSQTVEIPATGDGLSWETMPMGEIELPAEEAVIELKPMPDHWNPIQLRKLTLTPVAE